MRIQAEWPVFSAEKWWTNPPTTQKKETQQLGSSFLPWVIFLATQTSCFKFATPMKKGAVR